MNSPARPATPNLRRRPNSRLLVVGGLFAVLVLTGAEPAQAPDEKRFAFDKDRAYLKRIQDFTPLAIGGLDAGERREQQPFEDLVLHAHEFNADELSAAARRDLSVGNLMAKDEMMREDVRFELVRFDGRLKRLKRIGSPLRLRDAGIPELYEAWVFPTNGPALTPVCFIVSEFPAGLQPKDDFTPGVPVTGTGYFLKIVEYPSYEPNPNDSSRTLFRRAPLLVGRAVLSASEPPVSVAGLESLLTVSLVLGGVLIAVLALSALWLRRSDAGTRRAVAHRLRNPYPDGGPKPPVWEQPEQPDPPEPPPATDTPNQS